MTKEIETIKSKGDLLYLELKNSSYTKNYFENAIKVCQSFKSRDTRIKLISEEEFLQIAPSGKNKNKKQILRISKINMTY
jgi:hypothetical protein